MKPKINFLTIAVTDLGKSVSFYKDGLGLPTKGIQEGHEDHCLFELDRDFSLVLYRRDEFLRSTGNLPQTESSAGFMISYFAESKEEVDNILQKALKAGGSQIGVAKEEAWGYTATFADPDGHHWEISYMPGNG